MLAEPRRALPTATIAGWTLALVATLGAGAAWAEPEPVRLSWVRGRGAEACPSADRVADDVARRLGRSPFSPRAPRSIDVLVTRTDAGYRAEIDVRSGEGALVGTRDLASDGPDCAALGAAAVLALALAIDPAAALAAPPPVAAIVPVAAQPPPLLVAPGPPPVALPPPASFAAPPPPSPASPGLGGSSVALRGGVGLGLVPQPSPGLGLVGAVGVTRSVAITAEGLFLPEVRASDGRFGFGLTAIAIGACVDVLHRDEIDLAACGAVWGGALHAVVYALIPDAPGDFAWAAVEIGPRLRVRLAPHVHAELGAHVFAPLVRRPFVVEGHADTVFRQSVIAAEPFLGLGANFR